MHAALLISSWAFWEFIMAALKCFTKKGKKKKKVDAHNPWGMSVIIPILQMAKQGPEPFWVKVCPNFGCNFGCNFDIR